VCGEQGHTAGKCKELTPPNPDEMYKGEGCGSDHDHEEEDRCNTPVQGDRSAERIIILKWNRECL